MQLQASIIVLTIKSNLNQGQLLYIFKAIIYCVTKWRSDYKLINFINEVIAQTWFFAKYSFIFVYFYCCHSNIPSYIFVSKHRQKHVLSLSHFRSLYIFIQPENFQTSFVTKNIKKFILRVQPILFTNDICQQYHTNKIQVTFLVVC